MASITLQRDVKANLNSINKVDGQILFTTDKDTNNNIYIGILVFLINSLQPLSMPYLVSFQS